MSSHQNHDKKYIGIWFVLLLAMIASIIIAELGTGPLVTIGIFSIAFAKAFLVIAFFMHLADEPRYLLVTFSTAWVASMIMFVGMFPDTVVARTRMPVPAYVGPEAPAVEHGAPASGHGQASAPAEHHGDNHDVAAIQKAYSSSHCASWLRSARTGVRYCASPAVNYHVRAGDVEVFVDDAPLVAADVKKGEKTFMTYCAACHQKDGRGVNGTLAANFVDDVERMAKSDDQLITSIREGKQGAIGTMPVDGGAKLTRQKRVDVLAYIRTLAKK